MQDELADRVERADGPSRELDQKIAIRLGWCYKTLESNPPWCRWHDPEGLPQNDCPAFTASLDAAMMLVPEGCEWVVRWGGSENEASATVARVHEEWMDHWKALGKTPALALTAAALRAGGDHGQG